MEPRNHGVMNFEAGKFKQINTKRQLKHTVNSLCERQVWADAGFFQRGFH